MEFKNDHLYKFDRKNKTQGAFFFIAEALTRSTFKDIYRLGKHHYRSNDMEYVWGPPDRDFLDEHIISEIGEKKDHPEYYL